MIALTGAGGFVGQNLVKYFDKFAMPHIAISRTDLDGEDFSKIHSAGSVIHLAGKAHDLKSVSNPEEYFKVNFELTKKLYDAFLESSCTKFIFLSSVKAVADHLDKPLTEDYTPNPKTPYGISKLMAERYIQDQPLPEGKSYYILRPCMIHGPGNKGNLNLLYSLISRGIPYPLAAFSNKRSFLSVENLCFVIKQILEKNDIKSGVYNIADDESLSTNMLVKVIANSLNRKAILLNINPVIIRFFGRLGDVLPILINTEKLDKLTNDYVVENTKIKIAIGKVLPVAAVDGIETTLMSYK